LFPRCIFSALDAQYCARMVQLIHELRVPNFSTLLCYDRVFTDISYIAASLTENEASRFGRFLCGMLSTIMRWHSDPEYYEKECGDFPGFITVVRTHNKANEPSSRANQLDYENFRHVCHKWQYKLTKALVLCLESGEYVQIRNALMILTKILPYFPMVTTLGAALEKRVEKVRNEEKDKRQDLYALAMGYAGQLKSRKSAMVAENEFHTKDKTQKAPAMKDIQERKRREAAKKLLESKTLSMDVEDAAKSSSKSKEDSRSRSKTSERSRAREKSEKKTEKEPEKEKAPEPPKDTSKMTMQERMAEKRRQRELGMKKETEEASKDDESEKRKRANPSSEPGSQEKLPKRAKKEDKDKEDIKKKDDKKAQLSEALEKEKKEKEARAKEKSKRDEDRSKSKSKSRARSRDRSESTTRREKSRR